LWLALFQAPSQHYVSGVSRGLLKRSLITLFLLFHLVAILSWSLPLNSLLIAGVKQKVASYMQWSGLFQGWAMFAPDPPKTNAYVDAEVTFRDGRTAIWRFPRMQELGFIQRSFKERYRKFSIERLARNGNAALWPDTARYIARQYPDAGNPPVLVRLIRHFSDIPPPEASGQASDVWYSCVFYAHAIQAGDLQ
jgi:hypothetical protein